MTKEQILEIKFNTLLKARFGAIVGEFSDANSNNGYDWVYQAMQEFADQELAKERERSEKLEKELESYKMHNECFTECCSKLIKTLKNGGNPKRHILGLSILLGKHQ